MFVLRLGVPTPAFAGVGPAFLLAHGYVDFVGAGVAFDAYWHGALPFFVFYFFTTARSLALRARGLKTSSCSSAVTGCLVSGSMVAS